MPAPGAEPRTDRSSSAARYSAPGSPPGGLAGVRGAGGGARRGRSSRIADAAGGVPDELWENAAEHCDEEQLAALVGLIALINAYNRVNVIVRQPAGDYRPGMFG